MISAIFFAFIRLTVVRYAALIQTKSPTNYDIYLTESIFKTRLDHVSKKNILIFKILDKQNILIYTLEVKII